MLGLKERKGLEKIKEMESRKNRGKEIIILGVFGPREKEK